MTTVEGRITAILETWPLQLKVATSSGSFDVVLRESTELVRSGRQTDARELRVGRRIIAEGTPSGGRAIQSARVEIFD